MTGRDFDTDPSTPGALRGATADTDPAGGAAEARKPNTDPGVGPPGPPLPGAARVAVAGAGQARPPPGPPGRLDSVEMLLDGMNNSPQPERQKMTPQSAGEAAAAYHAEHPVQPARTSPDEEPKVIVERPPLVPTVKVQREQVQAIIDQADAMRRAAEAEAAANAPVPVTMGPRVLIAAVAGLVVVLLIFLVARGKSAGADGTAGAASGTATAVAPGTATATGAAPATAAATGAATATAAGTAIPVADTTEEPAPAPPPTAHVPISALPAAPPTAPATTAKPRPRPTSTSDLGEFKTTFH